jgi:hypothetical protein
MKRFVLVFAAGLAVYGQGLAQEASPLPDTASPDIIFGGTHPPSPEVMALLQQYAAASQEIADGVMARSEAMAPLQSEGYFYHGMDGAPIGKSALNQRQLSNGLVIERSEILNGHLYQYEDTAIAAYHTRQSGEDRGRRFENLMTSNLIVMGKVDGEWKVLADIIGEEPSPPKQ